MIPHVFRDGPFRFFFFSREEERLHVHVQSAEGETKVWLDPEIAVARNHQLSAQDFDSRWSLSTSRRSETPGTATSAVEVTNISKHGFWLLIEHLRWPELDVDLAVDSIEHPERYPLTSQL